MKKRIVIYCASGYGERVALSLDETKYEIVAFSDSNPEIWNKRLYGGEVLPPNRLSQIDFDFIVISLSIYADQIRKDLVEQYDVDASKIIVYNTLFEGIVWDEERIIELRKCIRMLKERNIPGNMAEVGVYQGDFARLFNYYFPDKKLYLFDTFEGFDSEKNKVNECDRELFKDTSVELVLSKMKKPENCVVKKGFFPSTAKGLEETFCLVSLDTDLYEPIMDGLEFFYPKLQKGGYIFVHDFGSYHFEGVKDAVYKFCEKNNAAIVPLADRCLSVIICK